jgi:hypothetical protein
METLNSRYSIHLWESWDDCGKLHINYDVFLDLSSLSIYGAQGSEEYIIVSLETVFLSYQEWAFFNLIPTLQNFGLTIRKSYFWQISHMTTKLEHIRDETINNLTMKRVDYLSAVQNGEHQNDQVFTPRFFTFLRGEYSESNESLSANEDDVASLPNFKNL